MMSFNLECNYANRFVWEVNYDIWPMWCSNYIYEVNEWYIVNFYKLIFYYLFRWFTSIHCDIGGAPITFDACDRDFKEALNVGASKYDFSQ